MNSPYPATSDVNPVFPLNGVRCFLCILYLKTGVDNVSGSPDNEIVKIQLTFFCLIAIKKLPVLNGTHYSVLFVVVGASV